MIAIKVSSENIQELWKCPDVSELVKTVSGDCTKQTLIVRLRNREFYVPDGFYLVKDVNGRWSTLSPSLYELIKTRYMSRSEEEIREYHRRYYQEHKEHLLARMEVYRKENAERIAANRRYNRKRKKALGGLTNPNIK